MSTRFGSVRESLYSLIDNGGEGDFKRVNSPSLQSEGVLDTFSKYTRRDEACIVMKSTSASNSNLAKPKS